MSHDEDEDGGESGAEIPPIVPPAAATETPEPPDEDYGPPFTGKTFGGAFVWARSPGFVATVLRIRDGQNVAISTQNRRDMTMMLTAGRAVLEVQSDEGTDRVEVMPASPIAMDPNSTHRLLALTEVELFTIYMPLPA
jgi:hypothetical protein